MPNEPQDPPERAPKRAYASRRREAAAAATQASVLAAARALFVRRGVDAVTIAELAAAAGVSASTVYALFKSKEGVLRALMEAALFGGRYQAAIARLRDVAGAVDRIAASAGIARAIYEGESAELGLIRGVSMFSPALRKLEQDFEDTRLAQQATRIDRLYGEGRARSGLPIAEARRILWMYTSRDVYRMLVHEAGWAPDRYEAWLAQTLIEALVERP
jgi:AcrR family transcriptional regulator